MKTSVNEISLRYQNTKILMAMAPKINSSREAFNIFNSIWDQDSIAAQEQFNIMLLNKANRVKGTFLLSTGGITVTLVDIRTIGSL